MVGCPALDRLLPAWLFATSLAVLVVSVPRAAAEPPRSFTSEEIFTALIEPNLQPDGRLSEEARTRIHRVAARMLSAEQLGALDARLEVLTTAPGAFQPVAHLADAVPAPVAPVAPMLTTPACCADADDCCPRNPERLIDNLW